MPWQRVAGVEVPDARAEEAADLAPAGRHRATEQRQADVDVGVPQQTLGLASRHVELQRGDPPSGAYDPSELLERLGRLVDVAEEVGEGQGVEGFRLERQLLGAPLDQVDLLSETGSLHASPAGVDHPAALIHTDDRAPVPAHELDGNGCGAAGDVEDDILRLGLDSGNEKAPPARILTETQEAADPVVRGAQRCEEVPGQTVARAAEGVHDSILALLALEDELGAVARAAGAFVENGEKLTGIMAAEPTRGQRIYLCAYSTGDRVSWLALDQAGRAVGDRTVVRDAVSIVGLCELAEESAAGGDVAELRVRLAELRSSERPEGIEEAEAAAADLERALAEPPRVATPAYLDRVGTAAARLERTLGTMGASPFAEAMRFGTPAVDELARDVVEHYKRPLG